MCLRTRHSKFRDHPAAAAAELRLRCCWSGWVGRRHNARTVEHMSATTDAHAAPVDPTPDTGTMGRQDAAHHLKVDTELLQAAQQALQADHTDAFAVSGKIASGKDTVARSVVAALGWSDDVAYIAHGDAIKSELTDILHHISTTDTAAEAVDVIAEVMHMPADQARHLVGLFEGLPTENLDGWQRTDEVRVGLQYLASQVRRSQDPNYWVHKTAASICQHLAAGRHVVVTDPRTPNEVTALQAIGLPVIRVHVSEQVQLQRLQSRDGLQMNPEKRLHHSETALDTFDTFDFTIDNDGELADSVAAVVNYLNGSSRRTTGATAA